MEQGKGADRVKLQNIFIGFSESGHVEEGMTFFSWYTADRYLYKAAWNAPKDGGYHKTDYTVTWTDGEQYAGRLDLQHPHSRKYGIPHNSILHDVVDGLVFYSGIRKPYHMPDYQYQNFLKEYTTPQHRQRCRDLLENYDLNDIQVKGV